MGRPAWVFLDECGARLGSFWQGQVTRDGWSVLTDVAGRDPTKVMGHRAPFWEIAGSGGGGRGWRVKVGNSQGLESALKMFKLNTINLLLFFFLNDGESKSQKSRKY